MDIPEISLAVVAVMTALGGGIAFVWNKLEKRFSDIEKKLDACEERDQHSRRLLTLYEAALTVVTDALEQTRADAPALRLARRILLRAAKAHRNDDGPSVDEVLESLQGDKL